MKALQALAVYTAVLSQAAPTADLPGIILLRDNVLSRGSIKNDAEYGEVYAREFLIRNSESGSSRRLILMVKPGDGIETIIMREAIPQQDGPELYLDILDEAKEFLQYGNVDRVRIGIQNHPLLGPKFTETDLGNSKHHIGFTDIYRNLIKMINRRIANPGRI